MKYLFRTLLLAVIFTTTIVHAQPNYPRDPVAAQLISVDVENFIIAYKSLNAKSDTSSIIQELYLDKASQGLVEYIARFNLTAKSVTTAIQKYPIEYNKIEKFASSIEALKKDHIQEMEQYQKVLPNVMLPPTYLLVADYKGIAQASKFGQLISIEKIYTENFDKLKNTIIHELTHFQQAMTMGIQKYQSVYSQPNNMLDIILREGGADFVTHRLVRKTEDQASKLKNYEMNETELWSKFNDDLKTQSIDYWVNVTYDDDNGGNPVQVGYGLGYKIVASYYDQVDNKTQGLMDILMLNDAQSFLIKSNYKPL